MSWIVRKRGNKWGIYDRKGALHDCEDTFEDAVRSAQQYALAERIFQPDGLEWFAKRTGGWKVKNG